MKNKDTFMKIVVFVIMLFVFVFWILFSFVFKKDDNNNINIFENKELNNLKEDFINITDDFFKK
ncbi:hypothetical protein EOM09_01570 [bacterium]|nr:hypothetical protein [bacterium]